MSTSLPRGYGVTVTEQLWNGNKTFNSVRQAESNVFGQREQLRYTEQQTLLSGLTYYMNVMRDSAAVDLNKSNVEVLKEQLRQTNDRFNVGEVTRTDVAQAQAALAAAQATYLQAQATVQASIANYRQVIGDQPKSLAPVTPVARLLPVDAHAVDRDLAGRTSRHHRLSSRHRRRAAERKDQRSRRSIRRSVCRARCRKASTSPSFPNGSKALIGSIIGQISIPIYDGGATFAGIRQAKEQLSQTEAHRQFAARQGSPGGRRRVERERDFDRSREGRKSQRDG